MHGKVPVLTYLSGLTCTEDNGYVKCLRSNSELSFYSVRAQKGGFLAVASSQGIAILFPDTSPRGAGVPGEDDAWAFGTGAGFYLDATKPEYSKNYNMATHVAVELPQVIETAGLPVVRPCHSIRHQALLIFLLSLSHRISSGNQFSDTVWVVMAPSPCT